MLFAMVDGLDDIGNAVVPPLGQLRFLWFRMVAAVDDDDGDAADTFRIRKSILLRSQSAHALIFDCLAIGMISGKDDDATDDDDDE